MSAGVGVAVLAAVTTGANHRHATTRLAVALRNTPF